MALFRSARAFPSATVRGLDRNRQARGDQSQASSGGDPPSRGRQTTGAQMKRIVTRTGIALALTLTIAGWKVTADVRWPIPKDWKHETFALPPDFAPEFPWKGTEDLRFMPGFSTPAAPDYWSYDLVWWLDQA